MKPDVSSLLLLLLPLNYTPADRGIRLRANCSRVSSDKNASKSGCRHKPSQMQALINSRKKMNRIHVAMKKMKKCLEK